jgi:hypothetical protein
VLGRRFEGVETLLGRSERGRFVKAPSYTDHPKTLTNIRKISQATSSNRKDAILY